jgi:hypothetical protein
MSSMKLGTQVRFRDGREGTVVYNGLDGEGVKWGLHDPDPSDFEGTSGGLFNDERSNDWPWRPDAMLRDPYPGWEFQGTPCVGRDFVVVRYGLVASDE